MVGEIVHSVCPHDCPSTCALEVERLDSRTIGRVRGSKGNTYTDGVICAKVARYAERVHHPDRLQEPLKRTGPKGSGQFAAISWDAALDEIAQHFTQAAEQYGPDTVWPYYYGGTMGLVQRDGINRLRHVMGYARQRSTICYMLAYTGWLAGTGALIGPDAREMADSDLIVVWATNAVATQVNVMRHIAKARKTRGAKLVVVDPYCNATAEVADWHICPRPGTDGALACAMMHVLFAEGFADRDYLSRYTDVPNALEAHLETRTPAWAAAITGLDEQEIIEFARAYGAAERSFIRVGFGFSRSRNGAANMHAVSCLPAITGAWRQQGGGAFFDGGQGIRIDKTLIDGLDAEDLNVRLLDMSRIGAVLTGEAVDLDGGPPVTAMLIQNTNPMVVAPEHLKVREGLSRDNLFLCVHEQFMTETAKMADIVLPATTFLEHDDLYKAGGHSYLQIAPKVIEPFAQARSNHEVICAIAERLGADHPGFRMSAWDLIDATLKASGLPDAEALKAQRWHDCQPDFETSHFLNGFGTPDGRFHFAPDWGSIDVVGGGPSLSAEIMPKLPDHMAVIEESDAERPFRLITPPSRSFLNSSFTQTPTSVAQAERPTVLIHPAKAESFGIADGAIVIIGNRRAEVSLHARLFDGMQPDVLVVEGLWPNATFVGGVGINALTSADSPAPNGGSAFHDTAVWIRSA